jgi:hypothetical protein
MKIKFSTGKNKNFVDRFEKFYLKYPIQPKLSIEEIKQKKLSFIKDIGNANSIRDYGGLWGVVGLYLLEGARALNCSYAEMIDATPIKEFSEKVENLKKELDIQVTMKTADFRDSVLFKTLDPVDVSLLYEVILHQENAVEVLKNCVSKTLKYVCIAQPTLMEDSFILPNGCVNLQFYPEELKDILRCDYWPKEPVITKFETQYWMWGQTVSYFKSVLFGLGWDIKRLEVYQLSEFWNYSLMLFVPKKHD